MPLEVIKVDYGKQESIFEKFLPFVEKLVGQYKQSQQNKWDNEWMSTALKDIEMAGNKEDIDAYIFKKDPPEELLDTEGMTNFAGEAMGLLMQKEIMTGGLTPTVTPKEGEQPSATEIAPDVKEFNELYKFVSELPTGKVDWTNTLDLFKKKLETNRAMGSAAQNFLNMIMGQIMPTDQRAKFEQDYGLAKDIKSTLYPEEEKPRSELEYWLKEHPEKGVEDYWKAKAGPEKGMDVEKFNQWLKDSDFIIKGGSVNPVTGNINYNFGPDPEGDKTLDQVIAEAKSYCSRNPGMEISNINFATGTVSVGQKGKPETGGGRPDIQKFLFGDTGIISDYIKGLIDDGMPLEEEDKALVIANYKLRKHTLTEAEVKEVELFFDQIGIDPYEIKPEPEVIDPYAGKKKEWWEFWEGVEDMSEDQLKEAILKGNKKAYEEAIKRGYITK